MAIKWVVLDMMGVVFEEGDTLSSVLFPYLNGLKGDISRENINALYALGRVGRLTSKQIFETLGFKENPEKIEEGFLKLLKLDPQFYSVAENIRKKYKLAALSNDVSGWSERLRALHGLNSLFDVIVISGDYGTHKPEEKIFNVFLEKANAKPSECVFVDDKVRNLVPAEKLGFKTIKFVRETVEDELWNTEIRSFKELIPAIERF
ncbi:MAG: HAD-IA family hydrolase [Candidatus Firestonebacteria bacterium]